MNLCTPAFEVSFPSHVALLCSPLPPKGCVLMIPEINVIRTDFLLLAFASILCGKYWNQFSQVRHLTCFRRDKESRNSTMYMFGEKFAYESCTQRNISKSWRRFAILEVTKISAFFCTVWNQNWMQWWPQEMMQMMCGVFGPTRFKAGFSLKGWIGSCCVEERSSLKQWANSTWVCTAPDLGSDIFARWAGNAGR